MLDYASLYTNFIFILGNALWFQLINKMSLVFQRICFENDHELF